MQKGKGYLPYKLRTVLVPITNIGSRLALPLVLLGLLLDLFVLGGQDSQLGFYLALAGVVLYGLSTLFMLVTLPVEFNASRRAIRAIENTELLSNDEVRGAKKVLTAAAMTYVAALASSVVQLLRLITMANNRRR